MTFLLALYRAIKISLDFRQAKRIGKDIEPLLKTGAIGYDHCFVLRQEHLSEQFAVSRTPVREALRRLTRDGGFVLDSVVDRLTEVAYAGALWVAGAPGWLAVAFTVTVLATVVALAQEDPIIWVSYLPLLPLALLFFSGLYLFALPYVTRRRVVPKS